jgi:hypothetical protein
LALGPPKSPDAIDKFSDTECAGCRGPEVTPPLWLDAAGRPGPARNPGDQCPLWPSETKGGPYETPCALAPLPGAFPGRRPPALGTTISFQPIAGAVGWSARMVRGVREPVTAGMSEGRP